MISTLLNFFVDIKNPLPESQEFDLNLNTEGDYRTAIKFLKNHYNKKESEHVAWVTG